MFFDDENEDSLIVFTHSLLMLNFEFTSHIPQDDRKISQYRFTCASNFSHSLLKLTEVDSSPKIKIVTANHCCKCVEEFKGGNTEYDMWM